MATDYEAIRTLKQRKKTVTGTYTARTGRPTDSFVLDHPIDIADPAADFTLTIPDGVAMGQELLIVMSSNDDSKTATISFTHHESADAGTTSLDAADEAIKVIWTGTEWDTILYSCAADVS